LIQSGARLSFQKPDKIGRPEIKSEIGPSEDRFQGLKIMMGIIIMWIEMRWERLRVKVDLLSESGSGKRGYQMK